MPTVCEFSGIKIAIYSDDHPPPHFHVAYAGQRATYTIATRALLRGTLPPRVERAVIEWAERHEVELSEAWDRAKQHRRVDRIAP